MNSLEYQLTLHTSANAKCIWPLALWLPLPKVIRDSNPDFRTAPKCTCSNNNNNNNYNRIHSLVGISHFTEYYEKQPVTVWEMLINPKCPFRNGEGSEKMIHPERVSRTGSPPKVKQPFPLVGPITTSSMQSAEYLCSNPVDTNRIDYVNSPTSLAEITIEHCSVSPATII